MYDLFLDDERMPPRSSPHLHVKRNWVIARTCDEAMAIIRERGIPRKISFDHDLGLNQPTGMDFAKQLVAWCMDNDWPGFDVAVHSMNPVGKRNIELYIGQYLGMERPHE